MTKLSSGQCFWDSELGSKQFVKDPLPVVTRAYSTVFQNLKMCTHRNILLIFFDLQPSPRTIFLTLDALIGRTINPLEAYL